MNCPNCGTPNEPGAGFCANCGAPLPQAATPAAKRSRLPIIAVVVLVAVVVLCCCLAILAGGGMGLSGYLMASQATPTQRVIGLPPTAMPTPPRPTEAPATRIPTRVLLATELPATPIPPAMPTMAVATPGTSVVLAQTYSSNTFLFSMRYPAGWSVKESENSVLFNSGDGLASVSVGAVRNYTGDDVTFVSMFVASLRGAYPELTVVSSGARTVNGLVWPYSTLAITMSGVETTWVVHGTVHNNTGYAFLWFATAASSAARAPTFMQMMETFQFLEVAPATATQATATQAAAGVYRATVQIKTSAGQPYIRGRVTNRNGQPVRGALIELYNAEKNYLLGTGTGSDGRYELTISAGVYYMKLKNYNSAWSPLITVKWGQEAQVDWKEQ